MNIPVVGTTADSRIASTSARDVLPKSAADKWLAYDSETSSDAAAVTPSYDLVQARREDLQQAKEMHRRAVESEIEHEIERTEFAVERAARAYKDQVDRHAALSSGKRNKVESHKAAHKLIVRLRSRGQQPKLWNGKAPAKERMISELRIILDDLGRQREFVAGCAGPREDAYDAIDASIAEVTGKPNRMPRARIRTTTSHLSDGKIVRTKYPTVDWPMISLPALPMKSAEEAGVEVIDALGLLVFAIGEDAIREKLRAQMDTIYDQPGFLSMSRDQKRTELAKLDQRIADTEQQEMVLVWEQFHAGGKLDVRRDVSPEALLGIVVG